MICISVLTKSICLQQFNLLPTIRQRHAIQHKRPDPQIHAPLLARRAEQLVLREVEIPVCADAHRVRPVDPWIPYKRLHRPVGRVERDDRVGLDAARVHEPVRVALQPVRDALLRQRLHGARGHELRGRALGAQQRRRHAEQVPPADDAVVECRAVGGERDAVGAERHRRNGLAHARVAVDGRAPDLQEEAGLRPHGWDIVEVAPRGPRAEVNDHDPVAAFGGGVGDVGDAFAGGGQRGAQVETDVVEVRVWEGDGRGKEDSGEDGVVGEVDADEFGAAEGGGGQGAVGEGRSPRVEDPEAVGWVDNDTLDADEVVRVADTGLSQYCQREVPARARMTGPYSGIGRQVDPTSWRCVVCQRRVRRLSRVGCQFSNCIVRIRWIEPRWIVGEHASR